MSCGYTECYLPDIPRVWSRVQGNCSLRDPMLQKGNILQYKANSSSLTKIQRYSKIAQGLWVNRNTTWATQGFISNPNTSFLKRGGDVTNLAIDPITGAILGTTYLPITYQNIELPKIVYEGLPSQLNESNTTSSLPENIPTTDASANTFPTILPDVSLNPLVIPNGGTLICTMTENPFTGEITQIASNQICYPSSASDVPGLTELCWKDGTQTWIPRSRYVMSNSSSGTDVPLTSSVRPFSPILTDAILEGYQVTLTWTYDQICLPVSFFAIYQNNLLVQTLPNNVFSTVLNIDSCTSYEFYIVAITNGTNITSVPSNIISIDAPIADSPQNILIQWSASDTDQTIMCMSITFQNPLTIGCGIPKYFNIDVLNQSSEVIATTTLTYLSNSNNDYQLYFNNIPYSLVGEINIFLITQQNDGSLTNGKSSRKAFLTSSLPIFINQTFNNDRSFLTFDIISLTSIKQSSIYYILDDNNNILYNWNSSDTISQSSPSPYLYVATTNLFGTNEIPVYSRNVQMYASLFQFTSFQQNSVMASNNDYGVGVMFL
jgi:hypothetical protein